MSSNFQLLNIINDIEELNEETSTINENIVTINGTLENLEDNKQDNIKVTDTIQISKLKTQYITMSLTGQDLQTTLSSLDDDISDISNNRLSLVETNLTDISNNRLYDVEGYVTDISNNRLLLVETNLTDISNNRLSEV